MSVQKIGFRSMATVLAMMLVILAVVIACKKGPGAGTRWTNYPALASSTTSFRWIVVKCRLGDVTDIPAGLDTNIEQFFGISGAGYGNILDYFHDVSYNRASVLSDTFIGWIRAPFNKSDLAFPNGRLAPAGARAQRVTECLNAIPADQAPDLSEFYGVVVVNNAVQDGGACYIGQQPITVNNKSYNLACVWFDPNSLSTEFAAHEIGHGLGLNHSFDDSGRICAAGGQAGEYCDPWDIMSAQLTYQFADQNWLVARSASGGGPGLDAPGLLNMGWMPTDNQRHFQIDGDPEQTFKLRALSHPRGTDPLVVFLDVGGQGPFDGIYTVEYRQGDGWDRGFTSSPSAPQAVRTSGGTVLVHQFRAAGAPASLLINGAFSGALQPCNTLVITGADGLTYHVTVDQFDTADGSATVRVGTGRGKFVLCLRDRVTKVNDTPAHVHVPPDAKVKP